MEELSEFEKRRLENIQRNQQILKELEIDNFLPQKKVKPAPKTSKNPRISKPKDESLPHRRSARLSGVKPELAPIQPVPPVEYTRREARDGDIPISPSDLTSLLQGASETKFEIEFDKENADFTYKNMKPSTEAVKLSRERILAGTWHPSTDVMLLCAGDKYGGLAIYNHNSESSQVFSFRPHDGGLSCLQFSLLDSSKLYSSSYDGTIRYLDVESHQFTQVLKSDSMITSFDLVSHTLYIGDSDGELRILDTRSKQEISHSVSEKKVSCVHVNPVDGNQLLTSGLDRTWKLWDMRNMSEFLYEFQHEKSCTSAYWNHDGTKVVSTSFDDTVQIFNIKDTNVKHSFKVRHNNQTGRWVTNFRARFHPHLPHIFVANMDRNLDVINSESGKMLWRLLDTDVVTAIPSVVAIHPSKNVIGTLNASGKAVIWE